MVLTVQRRFVSGLCSGVALNWRGLYREAAWIHWDTCIGTAKHPPCGSEPARSHRGLRQSGTLAFVAWDGATAPEN
ncbi:hypothetical protein D3C76_1534040 [compost metagenome]